MRYRVSALALLLVCSFLGLRVLRLAAQDSQDTSVADAARRAKEQKKSAAKPAKLVTNDSLPAVPAPTDQPAASPDATPQPRAYPETSAATTASPESPTAPSGEPATTDAKTPAGQQAAPAEAAKAKRNPEVEALKQQITEQQKQVDLLLRLNALDQDTFLSNPDHARDIQGKAKLDAQQEEIHAKVAEVARLKAKLEAIAPGESVKVQPPKP
jgi:hypothetical protein